MFSTLGSLPWNVALISAGFVVGENYEQIEAAIKPYEYVIYAVVFGSSWRYLRRRWKRGGGEAVA